VIVQARKEGAAPAVDDLLAGSGPQSGRDVADRRLLDANVDPPALDLDVLQQHGSVGPAKAAATAARGMSISARSPLLSAARQVSVATSPVRGSAMASAQKHGPALA